MENLNYHHTLRTSYYTIVYFPFCCSNIPANTLFQTMFFSYEYYTKGLVWYWKLLNQSYENPHLNIVMVAIMSYMFQHVADIKICFLTLLLAWWIKTITTCVNNGRGFFTLGTLGFALRFRAWALLFAVRVVLCVIRIVL